MNATRINRDLLARHATARGFDPRTALALTARPRALSASPIPAAIHVNSRTSTAFFPLGTHAELRQPDLKELWKKSRYLRHSCGLYRALIEKPCRFSIGGGLVPSAATLDAEFNKAADDYFERWANVACDVSGEYDFYMGQPMLGAEMHCDGDVFAIKVRSGSGRCQLQFLRAHQVGDHGSAKDAPKRQFRHGVLTNSLGRPLAYRVLQDAPRADLSAFRDYSAEDVLRIADPLRLHFGRGLPWGYHGQNSTLDILDMRGLDQVARKLNLALAAVITKAGAKPGQLGPPVDLKTLFNTPAAQAAGDAAPETPQAGASGAVSWEQILGGGAIPVLGEGEEFKPFDTDRSPINWIQAAEFSIRDLCIGFGVSYEFLWNMAALGGPSARFSLEDLNAFCAHEQRIMVSRFCQSVRSWVIANAMLNGEIPECKAQDWWLTNWAGPQKVTIDRGRDGQLFLRLLEKGMLTLDEWWSALGKDARKMRNARIDEIAEDLAYCAKKAVPYALYTAPAAGTPAESPAGATIDGTPILDPSGSIEEIAAVIANVLTHDPALLGSVRASFERLAAAA